MPLGFLKQRLSSLHHPLIITHNWNAELEFATKINSYLVMACPFSLHTLHFLMSINSVCFYIQFHAQTPTTLLQKKKTFILFWCFFTFVLKRNEISEWLDWCFEFTVYLGPWLESMPFLRAGFVEWRQQYFGIFFWLELGLMWWFAGLGQRASWGFWAAILLVFVVRFELGLRWWSGVKSWRASCSF